MKPPAARPFSTAGEVDAGNGRPFIVIKIQRRATDFIGVLQRKRGRRAWKCLINIASSPSASTWGGKEMIVIAEEKTDIILSPVRQALFYIMLPMMLWSYYLSGFSSRRQRCWPPRAGRRMPLIFGRTKAIIFLYAVWASATIRHYWCRWCLFDIGEPYRSSRWLIENITGISW